MRHNLIINNNFYLSQTMMLKFLPITKSQEETRGCRRTMRLSLLDIRFRDLGLVMKDEMKLRSTTGTVEGRQLKWEQAGYVFKVQNRHQKIKHQGA